jgi:predicted dehydrogenase
VLKGALLGAGNVAVNGHLPGWLARQDAVIVAAADPSSAFRDAILERIPGLRWYGSAQELLSRETLDFADIAAPPAMHAGLAAAALAGGLHVLCEKPLVLSPEELAPLEKLARQENRVLATVHNWRHAPIVKAASELLFQGAIGEVRSLRWETLREKPAVAAGAEAGKNWRMDPAIAGGGVLVDHGWHAFYVVRGWLPEAPCRVSARLSTRRHREWPVEDTAEVSLETAGGVRAEILLTWAAAERRNRASIEGTRGAVRLDGDLLERTSKDSTEPVVRSFPHSLAEGSHHPDWFSGVAAEFLAEIADPGRRGRSLAEASLCADLIAGARESDGRGGQPVSVGPREASVTAAETARRSAR